MIKYIISEEEKRRILNLHESFKKGVLTEQYTKVEGPFTDKLSGIGDMYIMSLDKSLCLYSKKSSQFYNKTYLMTGSTCGEEYTTIHGGKFYVQFHNTSNGKIESFLLDSPEYVSATNNGLGYNSKEEAKKGVSLLLNPQHRVGRNVEKQDMGEFGDRKIISRYDRQGNLKRVKIKSSAGTQKYKTGL